jgi:hypothetical protein
MAAVTPINSDSYGFSPVATTPAGMAAPTGIAAPTPASKVRAYALVGLCFGAVFCLGSLVVASVDTVEERDGTLVLDVAGGWEAPAPHARCAWIEAEARARDAGKSKDELAAQYAVVAEDANSFYRGTAHLFWYDFVVGGWGEYDLEEIGLAEPELADGSPIGRTATWTWVTGDQHLSNFGAWKNRKGDVVLGVNDFDEAAIYDFRIDVWRARGAPRRLRARDRTRPGVAGARPCPSTTTACRTASAARSPRRRCSRSRTRTSRPSAPTSATRTR